MTTAPQAAKGKTETTFEGWCIVELFGHQQIAGKVSEKSMFGTTLMRIEVPATSERPAFTKFYGGGAVYAITPVEQAVAVAMAEALNEPPIQEWRLKTIDTSRKLPSGDGPTESWASDFDEDEDPFDSWAGAEDDDEAINDTLDRLAEKAEAAKWAEDLLKGEFVIFDTETTGLNSWDEIIQIGVIDQDGNTVFESLIKPTKPITNAQYHGITDEMVNDAPPFSAVYQRIKEALDGKIVVAYNFEYDNRVLQQNIAKYGPEYAMQPITFAAQHCAMNWYAQYNGEWNDYHGNYRWQKLGEALAAFGLKHEDVGSKAHDACTDARATLAVIKKMAGYREPPF